jgi:hypothetical protein
MPKNEAQESKTCICGDGRNNQLEISEFSWDEDHKIYCGRRLKY